MKKIMLTIVYLLLITCFTFATEKEEEKDFFRYSIEKNFYPEYEIKVYNDLSSTKEENFSNEQDIYIKSEGKLGDLNLIFKYTDKEDLMNKNQLFVGYKDVRIGDVEIDNELEYRFFRNNTKIFGLDAKYGNVSFLSDFAKTEYKKKEVTLGNSYNEMEINSTQFIDLKFIRVDGINISEVYFDDGDKTNNEKSIELNNGYYDLQKENVDYVVYGDFVEFIKAKNGRAKIIDDTGEEYDLDFSKEVFNYSFSEVDDYSIEIKDAVGNFVQREIIVLKNKDRIVVKGGLNEDEYIFIRYYTSNQIINLGEIDENSLKLFSEDRLLEKDEDYFFDLDTGIISFFESLEKSRKITIYYKQRTDNRNSYYGTEVKFKDLLIKYDLDFTGIKRNDKVGVVYAKNNLYIEFLKEIEKMDKEDRRELIDLSEIYEESDVVIEAKKSLYNEMVLIEKDEEYFKNTDEISNINKITYRNTGKIRNNLGSKLEGSVLGIYVYGNGTKDKLKIRVGSLNEDFDNDGILDTEDENNDGKLGISEDNGVDIFGVSIGENNEYIDTEDIDNDGFLNIGAEINRDYSEIEMEIDFFGWEYKEFEIKADISIRAIEFEFETDNNYDSEIYIGDIKVADNVLRTEQIEEFSTNDDYITFLGNSEKSYIEYIYNKKNSYKKLEIDIESSLENEIRVDINNKNVYQNMLTGRKKIVLDIDSFEDIYSIKIFSKGEAKLYSIDGLEPKTIDSENYYLKYNYKDNIFSFERKKEDNIWEIKNIDAKSRVNYILYKSDEKNQVMFSSRIKDFINFKYEEKKTNTVEYRDYRIFYLTQKGETGYTKRKKTYDKYDWKYKFDNFSFDGEIKNDLKIEKYQGYNNLNFSLKNNRFAYKIKYSETFENDLSVYLAGSKQKLSLDLKYKDKENFRYDYEMLNFKFTKHIAIGAKRENRVEYAVIEEKWNFPVIDYKKEYKDFSLKTLLDYELINNYYDFNFNIFYKFANIELDLAKNEEFKGNSKVSLFYGEFSSVRVENEFLKDSFSSYKLNLETGYKYKENIEIKPYIEYKRYIDTIEVFRSYNLYIVGLNLKASI